MKKSGIWIAVIAAVVVLVIWGVSAYNGLVTKEENVEEKWSQVENVYQRRADLINNLVAIVAGYAEHEKSTLQGVVEARAKATSVQVDPSKLNETNIAQFEAAQSELSSALSRLMVVVEKYPDLKANENFILLQSQLEGTENRISVERKNFNEAAKNFNTAIRVFPKNIIANMCGFEKKAYFAAKEGADVAPVVEF
ncbi:MAG: LemA family protein [Bacteroidales bacterium]|jgi:LemA protein|nr:LemA family protein [Bacteroidales bacterium]